MRLALALFDLDRTLIDLNSASLWVKHEWRAGRLKTGDAVYGAWSVLRYNLGYDQGVNDVYRSAVRRLEGQSEEELDTRTRTWFDETVVQHLRPGARAAIDAHRAAGDRLVIATSSSAYAAAAARDAWAFDDIIHTSFAVQDGLFTGEIDGFAYGANKLDRVAEWAANEGEDLDTATFYTDSVTDLALMEAVGTPVAVNPDRRLRKVAEQRGWTVVDWGTAPVR